MVDRFLMEIRLFKENKREDVSPMADCLQAGRDPKH
jgi:hypothetical protein